MGVVDVSGFLGGGHPAAGCEALVDASQALDYAQLRSRVLEAAGQLVATGVRPGDIVAVACDRSAHSVVGILAVYAAGAAYLPLDLSYPKERLSGMVEDARPVLALAGTVASRVTLESLGLRVVTLEGSGGADPLAQPVETRADAPAYVLFTSGSTGRPKGAVLSRRALAHLVDWHVRHPRLGVPSRTLQFATLGFDSSVRDVFATFATGGTLVMATDADRRDPFRILELMRAQRVERAFLPYAALRAIAQAYAEGAALPCALRDVMSGGEAVAVTPAIRQLFAALPGAALYNEYGPTEACVFVTSKPLLGDPSRWPEYPDLGEPLPHVRLHVVDACLRAVSAGTEGELAIGGDGLADGYINQPALTAERFVEIECANAARERVYRSGDRVRQQPDGRIVFLGREDDQVKIAGFRVELAEVEAVLASCPAVREVAVVAPHGPHGRRLTAFVVYTDSAIRQAAPQDQLRRHIAQHLPEFERPRQLLPIVALPLTPNGKIDRRKLESAAEEHGQVGMAESLEDRVCGVWRELLGRPGLGPTDDVFDHGADSLSIMGFVVRSRAVLGRNLDASAIYEAPTPRQQVQRLADTSEERATPASMPAVEALPVHLPLDDGQREKWFFCQNGGTAALAFNESFLLRFRGTFDAEALKRALGTVWSRHEAFSLAFDADGVGQRVQPNVPVPITEVDCPQDEAEGTEAWLQEFCRVQIRLPFDLTKAPLARFRLIRLDEHNHVLHVVIHHLVMDGWSVAVFVGELAACYNAMLAQRDPGLPQPGSFRRYLVRQESRRSQVRALTHAYWRRLYATVPPVLELPSDRVAAKPDFSSRTRLHAFAPVLTDALRRKARRLGVSLYALLLSGFGVLLNRLSGQADLVVMVPFAGLALEGHDALIGDSVSTLPIRLRPEPGTRLGDYARQTHQALLDSARHQGTTFSNILRELGLRAQDGQGALTGVSFNMLPRMPAVAFEGLEHVFETCPRAASAMDLAVDINETAATICLAVHFATARFEATTISRWITGYETVLQAIAETGDEGCADPILGDIPTMGPEARKEVLQTWNDTDRPHDRSLSLSALIEAQMSRTPHRVAVECGGERLDYAGLERATRAVAKALLRRRVGHGDIVGVCVPRSVDMLVAVLGILRSGAAYVPLDPEFPSSRLEFMASQARLRHVLTRAPEKVPAVVAADRELLAVAALRTEADDPSELPMVRGDDLAYVLFTSGSTGEPKGVRILHRNLVNFLTSMREEPGFSADDVLCAATTLSFDIAGMELYLPLITGSRVVIATEEERAEPALLCELMARQGCNVLQTTPSLLQLLRGQPNEILTQRMRLFVGGEAMPLSLARSLAGQCRELWNLYGPTETTIWSTVARVEPGMEPIPLGKPIANTRIYVLDERGQPVPPGVVGEIWIGGDGVADGYLHRPDLTAERFVDDPFAGGRMYRTGDRGSWREGVLYFSGRADDQIKIRGYRIEPGDIEAVAAAEAGVRECVAVAQTFGDNDVRLVLYVAAGHDDTMAERLRARMHRQLPTYMQPQHIERMEALPKTPNGKIDRKALPRPTAAALRGVRTASAPLADPRQAYLAAIWRELIGVEHVRAEDSFFDLGGHSLLAVEFVARVQRETSVRLRLLDVASGTLAMLASELPAQAPAEMPASLLRRLRRRLGWV